MTENSCTASSGISWPTGGEQVVVVAAVEQDVGAGRARAVDAEAGAAADAAHERAFVGDASLTFPASPTRSYGLRVSVGSSMSWRERNRRLELARPGVDRFRHCDDGYLLA